MNASLPDPRQARRFHFTACGYDAATGIARLGYRFDEGPELIETVRFPHAPWPPDASRQAGFQQALQLLHAIAGISYYKAGLPPEICFDHRETAAGLTGFLRELYAQGLAEFAYVNDCDVAGRLHFPEDTRPAPAPLPLLLPDRALVAMGGGKDSLVGMDLMQRAGVEVMPICVGRSKLIQKTVEAAGMPLIAIDRQLAPELSLMNAAGAWNGHVPVTAINSAILICAALLYGFRYVVFSNERSADEATRLGHDGLPVNHQYSKSSAFEASFRKVVAERVSPDVEYFSILRPFSELGVVRRFSGMRQFHPVFSSCNRNFHVDGPHIEGRWCGDCPKCRFAALSLALFLEPPEVAAIQGADLLDDPRQADGFRALCGLGRDKPFECVGEIAECRASLASLGEQDSWRDHAVIVELLPELAGQDVPALEGLLRPSGHHFIPAHVLAGLVSEGILNAGG